MKPRKPPSRKLAKCAPGCGRVWYGDNIECEKCARMVCGVTESETRLMWAAAMAAIKGKKP